MKQLAVIITMLLIFCAASGQNGQGVQQQVNPVQVNKTEEQTDKNAKAITLLTIAVSALASFIGALLLYIKKMHSKHIAMATKFVEATMNMTASQEKLADSIQNSGDKISGAIDRNERTTDDLHKFILSKMH